MRAQNYFTKHKWHLLSGIGLLSILLNLNTVNHGFIKDDYMVVVWNQSVKKGLSGLSEIWTHGHLFGFDGSNTNTYRPLPLSSFALEYQLFGNSPTSFHVMNILAFALLSIVLLIFLFKTFPKKSHFIPIGIALLFVTHPIHTEVIANIKSRDEIFALLFGLGSILLFIRFLDVKKLKYLIFSLSLFLLSLLSKENTLTFLAIIPLYLYYFKKLDFKDALIKSSLFLVPILIYFLMRTIFLDDALMDSNQGWRTPFNNTLFAASNGLEYLATNLIILLKYIQLSFFPLHLVHDYSIGTFEITNFENWKVWFTLGLSLLMTFIIVKGIKKRSALSFGILFFLITFSITSNFFTKIAATLGERFLFTPSIGIVVIIVFTLIKILNPIKIPKIPSYFWVVVFISILFGWKTITRNADWKDSMTLHLADVKNNPKSSRILGGLADEYRKIAEESTDQTEIKKASDSAIKYYLDALKYIPHHGNVHYNLGIAYQLGKYNDEAINSYKKAIELDNNYMPECYANLGMVYASMNKHVLATESFEESVKLNDADIKSWSNLAYSLFETQDYTKAITAFEKCNQLAHQKEISYLLNLGTCHYILKQYDLAKLYYGKVLLLDPDNAQAKQNLALISSQ